ncbi:MAG: hypothetical protein ACI901_000552 [Octadecabacter sp.]
MDDLLPLAYTVATVTSFADYIYKLQNALGLQMLLKKPSGCLEFAESNTSETDFLAQITGRTDCSILFDVNNVFVSATNSAIHCKATSTISNLILLKKFILVVMMKS